MWGSMCDRVRPRLPLLAGSAESGPVLALVRPESVRLTPEDGAGPRVVAVSFLGSVCRVQVELPGGDLVSAQTSPEEAAQLSPGTAVRVGVQAGAIFAVKDGEPANP